MDFFLYSTDTKHPSLGHSVGRPAHCACLVVTHSAKENLATKLANGFTEFKSAEQLFFSLRDSRAALEANQTLAFGDI
jgi:hypothetical protein